MEQWKSRKGRSCSCRRRLVIRGFRRGDRNDGNETFEETNEVVLRRCESVSRELAQDANNNKARDKRPWKNWPILKPREAGQQPEVQPRRTSLEESTRSFFSLFSPLSRCFFVYSSSCSPTRFYFCPGAHANDLTCPSVPRISFLPNSVAAETKREGDFSDRLSNISCEFIVLSIRYISRFSKTRNRSFGSWLWTLCEFIAFPIDYVSRFLFLRRKRLH